jgi:uncharacterized protein YkwD
MTLMTAVLLNLLIMGALVYSAFSGTKRGVVLIGLELVSFAIATILALATYHPVGAVIRSVAHVTAALGNIAAFILVWVLTEVICALIIRFLLIPRLVGRIQHSWITRVGGGALNALKTAAIITLGLIIFAGLPLSPATKRPITSSFIARHLLSASGQLPDTLAAGLGHDLNDSLNFFTITAEPESEQTIQLGFTTSRVAVNVEAEADMLKLLNRERTTRGLSPLMLNIKARSVARLYSADMFARGYFSHQSPEGQSPFDRMKAGGVKYDSAGENLALAPTLQLAHDGLMKSPGHKANILSTSYRSVGIGIVDGGPYGLMVTQDFTD